jgi:tetratricopeptide (TPR) repeat protein
MGAINWKEVVGWNDEQLEELELTAFAYLRQGKYDVALDILQALAVIRKDHVYTIQTLGGLLLEMDRPDEALPHLEHALKLLPDDAPTKMNKTKALFMLHRKEEGLEMAYQLRKNKNFEIASVAKALILAHS